jgi:hypothetical protein
MIRRTVGGRGLRAAAAIVVAAACGPAEPDALPDLGGVTLVMTTAADDYSAGGLAALDPDWSAPLDLATLHGDAVLSVDGATLYAINRLGMDTVRRYDALGAGPRWEVSTGRGSNPHAVARIGDRLAITRYEEATAWVVADDDGALLGEIDLSPWADGDGIPEMSGAVPSEGRALVALQRLDRAGGWSADPEGRVAILDLAIPAVERVVAVGPNPRISRHPDGGAVVVADDGVWRVWADGTVVGPHLPPGIAGTIGSYGVGEDGGVVLVTRPCPTCAEHTVWCLDAWDGDVTGVSAPIAAYLPSVAVGPTTAWVAARRGWQDPERLAGGLAEVDRSTCALAPPEAWGGGTLAPFALARFPS